MKPCSFILAAALLASAAAFGQTGPSRPDSMSVDGNWRDRISLDVGLSAGATLYGNGYDSSPYYSKYGFTLQIPIMLHYELSPHWRFSTGLRYDFNWDPLRNNVELSFNDNFESIGLNFGSSAHTGKQNALAFHSYLGIPLKFTWYPNAANHRLFSLSVDCFAACVVSQYFSISTSAIQRFPSENGDYTNTTESGSSYKGSDNSMNRWKLELGLTLSTDYLGLIHGIRFFGNLLPIYTDPLNNEKINTVGMTLFL